MLKKGVSESSTVYSHKVLDKNFLESGTFLQNNKKIIPIVYTRVQSLFRDIMVGIFNH